MRMIATKDMAYATRRLSAGDEFDAAGPVARLLTALGRARLVDASDQNVPPAVVGDEDGAGTKKPRKARKAD